MYVPYPNFRVGGARCLLFYFIFWGGGSNRPCMVQICIFKPFVDIKEGIGGIRN